MILCLLTALEPQVAMCYWLLDNPEATEEEIVNQAQFLAEAYERWKATK